MTRLFGYLQIIYQVPYNERARIYVYVKNYSKLPKKSTINKYETLNQYSVIQYRSYGSIENDRLL